MYTFWQPWCLYKSHEFYSLIDITVLTKSFHPHCCAVFKDCSSCKDSNRTFFAAPTSFTSEIIVGRSRLKWCYIDKRYRQEVGQNQSPQYQRWRTWRCVWCWSGKFWVHRSAAYTGWVKFESAAPSHNTFSSSIPLHVYHIWSSNGTATNWTRIHF